MGMDTEPETEAPEPPADRAEHRESRTGNHAHVETEAPDEDTYPIGTDGYPVPTLWARRDRDRLIACCPACAGEHVFSIPLGAPTGAADGFVAAPCDDIRDIGGCIVRERTDT